MASTLPCLAWALHPTQSIIPLLYFHGPPMVRCRINCFSPLYPQFLAYFYWCCSCLSVGNETCGSSSCHTIQQCASTSWISNAQKTTDCVGVWTCRQNGNKLLDKLTSFRSLRRRRSQTITGKVQTTEATKWKQGGPQPPDFLCVWYCYIFTHLCNFISFLTLNSVVNDCILTGHGSPQVFLFILLILLSQFLKYVHTMEINIRALNLATSDSRSRQVYYPDPRRLAHLWVEVAGVVIERPVATVVAVRQLVPGHPLSLAGVAATTCYHPGH